MMQWITWNEIRSKNETVSIFAKTQFGSKIDNLKALKIWIVMTKSTDYTNLKYMFSYSFFYGWYLKRDVGIVI